MFICGECGLVSEPRDKPTMVIVQRRKKVYPYRAKVNPIHYRATIPIGQEYQGGRRPQWKDDPGGVGWEIAKEVKWCHDCVVQNIAMGEEMH